MNLIFIILNDYIAKLFVTILLRLCVHVDRREDASNLGREACDDGTKGSHAHLTLKGSSARAGRSTVTSLLSLVS